MDITDEKDLEALKALKANPGIEILPEEPSFCKGVCYKVLIYNRTKGRKVEGAIVFPLVESYPSNKIELIASKNIKASLEVREGDFLEIESE